ncbi:MAG: hypothetical protein EBW54_10105 [Betaproteobacteria bacterium]|nr:hypothetical protein [Betaproteobacteria bacterium]
MRRIVPLLPQMVCLALLASCGGQTPKLEVSVQARNLFYGVKASFMNFFVDLTFDITASFSFN